MKETPIRIKPVLITRPDGSTETVYISDDATTKNWNIHNHLTVIYLIVGTVSLALTAYVTYLHLKQRS